MVVELLVKYRVEQYIYIGICLSLREISLSLRRNYGIRRGRHKSVLLCICTELKNTKHAKTLLNISKIYIYRRYTYIVGWFLYDCGINRAESTKYLYVNINNPIEVLRMHWPGQARNSPHHKCTTSQCNILRNALQLNIWTRVRDLN